VKCARVLELVEDYYYEELDRLAADRLESHLSHCRECSEALESLEEESRLFHVYAKSIEQAEVKPEVWEAVRRRIRDIPRSTCGWRNFIIRSPGRHRQPLSRFGLACTAAVIILLVAIAVGYRYLGSSLTQKKGFAAEAPSTSPQAVSEGQRITPGSQDPRDRLSRDGGFRGGDSPQDRNSVQFAVWSIRRAEEEYIEAIEVLSTALSERKDIIDPQLVALFERDVKAVDRNIAASRKAYRARPRDFDLGQYMLTAYARKLEMLQTLGS
jgi:hypothetical protein